MSETAAPTVRASASLGDYFAEIVASRSRVSDPRIKAAFAKVPREAFLGPGPWPIATPPKGYVLTPSADLAFLYADVVVGLLPERAINNGEPSFHALCLGAAGIAEGETVVHVGAGAGYYSAIMGEVTGPAGRVEALEIEPELAAAADANLRPWPWVSAHHRSGVAGVLPEADVIYVNAGVSQIAGCWLDALKRGGRLLVPLTTGWQGGVLRFTSRGGGLFDARFLCPTGIIPCVGGQDPVAAERLSQAFAAPGGLMAVRSLRRGTVPDQSARLVGDDWWLSTEAV